MESFVETGEIAETSNIKAVLKHLFDGTAF